MNIQILSDNPYMNISALILFILFLFLMFLFVIFILSLFKTKKKTAIKSYPKVSIIIPVYNEENNILSALKGISGLRYDKTKIEVIIVDDGSEDSTAAKAKRFSKYSDYPIKIIKAEHGGKSEALNLGVRNCSYDYVFCIDADVILEGDSLLNLVRAIEGDDDVAAANCVVHLRYQKNILGWFQNVEYALNNLIRVSFSRLFDNSIWFFGAAALYKKKAIVDAGLFTKESLTEDMDMALSLYNKNYRILTVDHANIYTVPCLTLKTIFKQRMRWYFGAVQALLKNKGLVKKNKTSVPVLFLFANQFWWTFYSFISFPIIAYQLYYWFPKSGAFAYIFRWFSISGPFYVLYKIPEWGLNFLNIFGVLSGIITLIMSMIAIKMFKERFNLISIFALFFYFPYTILINLILITGMIKYTFSKKRYFID